MQEIPRRNPTSIVDYIKYQGEIVQVMRWIWDNGTTARSRKLLVQIVIYTVALIVCSVMMPFVIGFVFKGLVAHDIRTVQFALGGFGVAFLLKKQFERMKDRVREKIVDEQWSKLHRRVLEIFYSKSVGQHMTHAHELSVNFIDRAKGKIHGLQHVILFDGLPTVINLVMSVVFLTVLSPMAGLIVIVSVAQYIGWSLYLNVKTMQTCGPLDRKFREIGNRAEERMQQCELVKSLHKEQDEIESLSGDYASTMCKHTSFWLWFLDVSKWRSIFNVFLLLSIMSWGVYKVWTNVPGWNIGLLYPMFAWANNVCDNIWRLADVEFHINWNLPTIRSLIKSFALKPEFEVTEHATKLDPQQKLRVEFRDVSHHYPNQKGKTDEVHLPAIQGVSFAIEPGEKVALLGPSGAGKTTIMRLLLRHMDPTMGEVVVNGYNLKDVELGSYLQRVSYIPQESVVFDGTIGMNMRYGLSPGQNKLITDDEVWELMRLLRIDFGSRLTQGLDTVVGSHGVKLSGGQRQRLAIGRAVLSRPKLIVIDEATSNLDSITEREVQEGLETALAGDTSALVVAHRLATVENMCDKFVLLRPVDTLIPGESQIERITSTFEELWTSSDSFRELAKAQNILVS
jgi:ATP-binding cassette, subfamily B, heavy metal transporter